MHLFEVALLDMGAAAEPRRLGRRTGRAVERSKTLFHLGQHGLMLDGAGRGDDDVRRLVIAREIFAQLGVVERAHRLGRAEDRAAERLIGKRHHVEMLEDQIVRRVGHRADLLDDDVLLARQFHAVESGLGQNVGQHVERERHVVLEHARIVSGALGAGRGVEIAADRLDLLGDLTGRAPPRALERHMLEEMRNAVLVMKLVAAAGSDPYAERCRLQMRHGIGHHADAGFQGRHFNTHAAAPSWAARLVARTKRSTAA